MSHSPTSAPAPDGAGAASATALQWSLIDTLGYDLIMIHRLPPAVLLKNWTDAQVWSPGRLGGQVYTGRELLTGTDDDNPIRGAYLTLFNGDEYRLRSSWDQTAVMYAIEGADGFYNEVTDGRIGVWVGKDDPRHSYLEAKLHGAAAWHLDALMVGRAPARFGSAP